jgi:hypothetical protein
VKTLFIGGSRPQTFVYLSPALASGTLALLAFVLLGHTPIIRALGFAAAIGGVTLTLRRFGAALAIIGGLALAFSPAFWSQTGGDESSKLTTIALALGCALLVVMVVAWVKKMPLLGMGIGVVVFAVLFAFLVGTSRSLRVTTFLSAWLLYLIFDALLTANPRPDGPPPAPLRQYHTWGMLLLLGIGIWNDPLFLLLVPAVALTLTVSKSSLPRVYWGLFALVTLIGLRGMIYQYLDSGWWLYPAAQAQLYDIRVPYVMVDGWREASRWLYLINLVIGQFTPIGVLLGVLGLARLARWYPTLGITSMTAYAAYAIFGLVYFGRDSTVLLLPLLMIQMIWMTYAVHSFGQWLQKSQKANGAMRWLAPAAFTLLPIGMLFRIVGVL